MTVPTNTTQTFSQANIREDLIDLIFNVDPYACPIVNRAKKVKAEQRNHEWDTDIIPTQNLSNLQIEGDDATADSQNATARLGNYCAISRKTVALSGSLQAVRSAGGSNRMGYQILRNAKALKRDMEGILTNNTAKAVGNSTTATTPGSIQAYLTRNTVFNSGGVPAGANPTGVTTIGSQNFGNGTTGRTYSGTTLAITEAMLDSMSQLVYTGSGESIETLLVSAANKQNISKFTGPSGVTRFVRVDDKNDKSLQVAIDRYEHDFGEFEVMPDLFLGQTKDCLGIRWQYLRLAQLRAFETIPLAKTGDSDRKMLIVEYTLEVGNEHALGLITDTTG